MKSAKGGVRDAMPELERDLTFHPVVNVTPSVLSSGQIRDFNERGFVFPIEVFSAGEIAYHRRVFDEVADEAMAKGWGAYSINGWHTHVGAIWDLVTEPRILDAVEDLIGPDIVCWGTHYFAKMPGDVKRVSWHQDASYWPLTPSKTVTVWLAIDDADEANGAMQLVPRSHIHGQIDFEQSAPEEQNVLNQSVAEPRAYGDDPVMVSVKAGQMSLHTDLLLHGSEPNRSERRRCGLTMRFVPPDVRAYRGWNLKRAVVCRGRDRSGHWIHHPRPTFDRIPSPDPG
ncbi:MAG: phytanoyl-CoA dioxygenase family protein [Gemmatimonadetes bacterium]|nr:phytanoyl-CoA dioxygenase family protein [Gemmatimonadota bacterium]|tara:strand:+ start:321 stop:1175 length:855 start_codon:yes stop_codon:yes gene_type:complete